MISARQEKILDALIKEYISSAEPVSSKLLKTRADLDVSPATIRNDFKELTEAGYIDQPHTSAGRVPTQKAYRYFVDKIFEERQNAFSSFIFKEIEEARKQIENEMRLTEELMKSLGEISSSLEISRMPEKDTLYHILIKIGPSRTTYDKNIDIINKIIKELEGF